MVYVMPDGQERNMNRSFHFNDAEKNFIERTVEKKTRLKFFSIWFNKFLDSDIGCVITPEKYLNFKTKFKIIFTILEVFYY